MRTIVAIPLALLIIGHAGCGGDEPRAERAPEPAAAWAPRMPVSNGVVNAQVLWIERDHDHVAARLRLENQSDSAVQVRNLGDTLTGFRCAVEGRSYSAETRRREGPVTAAALAELPAQTPVELDLRWRLNALRSDSYDCVIVVSNLFQDGKKLPDLSLSVPGPVREDARARRAEQEKSEKPEKSQKPNETKPEPAKKDVSL